MLSGKPKNNLSSVTLRTELTAEVPEIFQTRIYHFLKEISEQKHDDLLVVAHSGVQRMIEIIREKNDPAKFIELVAMKNAQYLEYDLSFLNSHE